MSIISSNGPIEVMNDLGHIVAFICWNAFFLFFARAQICDVMHLIDKLFLRQIPVYKTTLNSPFDIYFLFN